MKKGKDLERFGYFFFLGRKNNELKTNKIELKGRDETLGAFNIEH